MLTLKGRVTLRVIVFSCWYFMASSSAYCKTLSLQGAIQKTLLNHPELHQFEVKNAILVGERKISALRPEFSLGLEVENFSGSGELQGADSLETTLSISSVLEMGAKREARVSHAREYIEVARWQKEAFTLDLLRDLMNAYIQALASQYEIRIANEAVQILEAMLYRAEDRAARGAAKEIEVVRAKAYLAKSKLNVKALLQRFEREKVVLAQFWNSDKPDFESLAGDIFQFSEIEAFDVLYRKTQKSPKMEIYGSQERLNSSQLALQKSESSSDIHWSIGVRHSNETGDSALTAGVSVPLFASRRNRVKVEGVTKQGQMLNLERQTLAITLHGQLFESYSLLKQNQEALRTMKEEIIPLLERALALAKVSVQEGRYGYQEIVSAQQELLETKQFQVEAAKQILLHQAHIEALTGETLMKQQAGSQL